MRLSASEQLEGALTFGGISNPYARTHVLKVLADLTRFPIRRLSTLRPRPVSEAEGIVDVASTAIYSSSGHFVD
jgi:hypothetical protein